MKLPRLRPRPAAETTEPAHETAEPASASPAAPALLVLAYSKAGLPGQEFSAQTEKLRSAASYDDDTRSGTPGSQSTTLSGPPRYSPPCSRPPALSVEVPPETALAGAALPSQGRLPAAGQS